MKKSNQGLCALTLALALMACQESNTNGTQPMDSTPVDDVAAREDSEATPRIDAGTDSMDQGAVTDMQISPLDQMIQHDGPVTAQDQGIDDATPMPLDQEFSPDMSMPMADAAPVVMPDAAVPEPDAMVVEQDAGCTPMEETCNGVDDDCDERVDESDPGIGTRCETNDRGPCARGERICHRGLLVCQRAVDPEAERCNGRDDDCDGRVDEALVNEGRPCQTGTPGVCSAGTEACVDGALQCTASQAPGAESCNGLDDDCDGTSDETFPREGQQCNTNRPGICRAGTRQCVNAREQCVSDQDSVEEVCDGNDQDCDGSIDEDAQGTGVACNPGWAIENCQRRATIECRAGELSCIRDPEPADPCNDIDNDCDGRIGEDVRGRLCNTGFPGRCSEGSLICEPGGAECASTVEPECETPGNEIDDDCDGTVDEARDRFCGPPESFVSRFCLDDNNQTLGLDMFVDELGDVFFTRGSVNLGHLYYSQVNRDGTQEKVRIHSRVGIFPARVLEDTSLVFFQGQPHICYRAPRARDLYMTFRDRTGEWNLTVVEEDDEAGADCALGVQNGQLVMAYRQGDELKFARMNAAGNWAKQTIDNPPGQLVGRELSLLIHNDQVVIAHRNVTSGILRLTFEMNGQWRSLESNPSPAADGLGNGFRPTLTIVNDELHIFHGAVPAEPDAGSDSTLYMTTTTWPPNEFRTEEFDIDGFGGGQAVMSYENGFLLMARYRVRNALGFRADSLSMRKVTEVTTQRILEDHPFEERRHLFTRLRIFPDPFGLPIMGFSDEGAPFAGDQGFAQACFYRPTDSDGDWVPDIIEHELGTDIFGADSDRDGRSDGEEILLDNTDPLRP